jgi:putative FmdB family regulatory protein
MPVYDYKCAQCSRNIEFKREFNDSIEPVCCNITMVRQWSSPGIVFNASGFYSTDNRKK